MQGPSNTSTGQIDIGGNTMITALSRKRVDWGGDDKLPAGEGVLIWDISDPVNPKQVGHYQTGNDGTHRNYYSGGRYMHLAASVKGYRGNIYQIVDISDPAKPVEAGRWSFPGQKDGETPAAPPATSLHGPPELVGNTVFLSYGGAGMVVVDIADVAKPKFVGRLAFSPPYLPFIGVHTIQPIPGKNLAVVNSEAIRENCNEAANHVSMVDTSRPVAAAAGFNFPDAAAARRLAVQELLRKGRPLRPAQPEPAAAQSVREEAGSPDLPDLLQRRAAHLRHQRADRAARGRLLHAARSEGAARRAAEGARGVERGRAGGYAAATSSSPTKTSASTCCATRGNSGPRAAPEGGGARLTGH